MRISADVDPGYRVIPADLNLLRAYYENTFRITAYNIADEADFGGTQVTNPCGLTGTDWLNSGRPLNRRNVCFTTTTCARTASGACAVAGTTIAVDPVKVPMGANVNIENLGNRTAQDTGRSHSRIPHRQLCRLRSRRDGELEKSAVAGDVSRRRAESMQLKTIAVALFTLLVAAAAVSAPSTPQAGCAALYVTGNELWSISAGVRRVSSRGRARINTPRWSPSGRRVAYVHDFQFGGDRVSDLVVIDSTSGENVTTIPIAEERGFNDVLQLGWRVVRTMDFLPHLFTLDSFLGEQDDE